MLPLFLALQLGGAQPALPDPPAADEPRTLLTLPPAQPAKVLFGSFARLQLGLGPPAFSSETSLLRREGYGGAKVWLEVDGAVMLDATANHAGLGLWGGVAYWSGPGGAASPSLNEVDYMVGAEIPLHFGSRSLAFLAAPRAGVVSGSLDLGGNAPAQSGFIWGAQVSGVSMRYHLSASVTFLSAAVGPPGVLGRDHNLGGLYFAVGALLGDG